MTQKKTNRREQQIVKDPGAEHIAISETDGLVVRKQIAVRKIEQLSK